jgi:hypothetical protein
MFNLNTFSSFESGDQDIIVCLQTHKQMDINKK